MSTQQAAEPRAGDQPARMSAVLCQGLRYAFGDHVAVDGIDLDVPAGSVFGLLGPNGAGKTTTIRVITTLLPARPGMVRVFGVDVAGHTMAVRQAIGYVPQLLSADSQLTGRENVALFTRLFDVPRRERRARVAEALSAMGLDDSADRLVKTYSGGMVRRLELAQALVNRPRLLILDEPTIGLDPVARSALWDKVTELRAATGATVLVTTHYMDEADQYCDRVALMHHGTIRALGSPAELRSGLAAETGGTPTLEDVFRAYTGDDLKEDEAGGIRNVRGTRRTANRLG
jgi:ABC-2 type transport system ATP-binding protein